MSEATPADTSTAPVAGAGPTTALSRVKGELAVPPPQHGARSVILISWTAMAQSTTRMSGTEASTRTPSPALAAPLSSDNRAGRPETLLVSAGADRAHRPS